MEIIRSITNDPIPYLGDNFSMGSGYCETGYGLYDDRETTQFIHPRLQGSEMTIPLNRFTQSCSVFKEEL